MKLNSNKGTPSSRLLHEEFKKSFLNFCSFVCIVHNKRLNLANIFLLVLKDDKIRTLYKMICDMDSDFEAIQSFLDHEPSLHKSKYITKYINATLNTKRLTIL